MSLVDTLLGRPLASADEESEKIGVLAGVPSLGLDGLSSAAYGPEAALWILFPLGMLGLRYIGPITLAILGLLLILYLSYRQTISAYPTGGGSYTVAKENLGIRFGLLAGAALMLDYTLNVAVGISAGVGALISAVPSLHAHTLDLCLIAIAILTIANLRGTREAGLLFAIPTYMFVGTLLIVIVIGIVNVLLTHGHPHAVIPPPPVSKATEIAGLWLLLKAFANGCTAMTGVEAVSNGVTMFAKPAIKNAQATLTAIVMILLVLLAGIAYLSQIYHIGAMDENDPHYQSVLSQLAVAVVGQGLFYYITLGSVLVVLVLSANTSYAGFPRLCRLLALDSYLPHSFSLLGRRLVYTVGIVFLTALAGGLLIYFKGITDDLIPLFAVGAFLAFTLSQSGMVMHWRRAAKTAQGAEKSRISGSMAINAIGAVSTATALVIILITKFAEGAWITVVLMPVLLAIFMAVKRHYARVEKMIAYDGPLDFNCLGKLHVIVPMEDWNLVTERALAFGLRLSDKVAVVHVDAMTDTVDGDDKTAGEESEASKRLRAMWEEKIVKPTVDSGMPAPVLEIIPSPYRRIWRPLLDYIVRFKNGDPDVTVAIIIPELVETTWWEALLHNHRATALKAALLLNGDRNTVVINVPWYLKT